MSDGAPPRSRDNRILVKLRPSASLSVAETRANLRPLHDPSERGFGLAGEARWFMAELPDGGETPWDLAHARVADQLGVAGSDVLFAEPDLIHEIYRDPGETPLDRTFQVGADCDQQQGQESTNRKATGPDRFAWHLEDDFSQLARARDQVQFTDPRVRIAHIDTGYFPDHVTTPRNVRRDLERNFVERDGDPTSAEDPNNKVFLLDNSGHGTGTLGILAGGIATTYAEYALGGAPEAEVLPLRVADRVVLLRTSAFARALRYAADQGCHVVSMSMGGLPANTWREEVDHAYLNGVCMVSAAGNNFARLPTRRVVYPARYGRVIAACGVMANERPYTGLRGREMQGNYGPDHVMTTALGAFTPNIPWPVFGCQERIRLNGAGTSSATPQVAAAAALWLEKHKNLLPGDWRRVEAVRHALFSTAKKVHASKLGNGILQAADALAVRPELGLERTSSDRDFFAAFRVLTGLGVVEASPRERMFDLEVMQRWLLNEELQKRMPDPDEDPGAVLDEENRKRLLEAIEVLVEDPGTSRALRGHLEGRWRSLSGSAVPRGRPVAPTPAPDKSAQEPKEPERPAYRRLRVYALDPSLSGRLETAGIDTVTLNVRWEPIEPGPVGEYLEVEDRDESNRVHPAADLQHPHVLATDGWAPAEGSRPFHQQMVYAVAMNTIEHFERALGRPVLWRERETEGEEGKKRHFVPRLTIRPQARREANAFYSPPHGALEFGYFDAAPGDGRDLVPGSRVYTCLSHDIIVHETTHAILDGMHRRFTIPSNPDVLALHEGFSDIVALMQHFTMPELLRQEIGRARGDLEAATVLGSLGVQFGKAVGREGALRDAIGRMEDGRWRRLEPDPSELEKRLAPHARGAILVAAVFDAFIAIYGARIADLKRIATGGTGILPAGALHPDLVGRFADEAVRAATHVLTICIRALDYLPPVDVTFFEYLRALITADHDHTPHDRYDYRTAFVEAFRRRGIHPVGLRPDREDAPRAFSVDTLRWDGFDLEWAPEKERDRVLAHHDRLVEVLRGYAEACSYAKDRAELSRRTDEARRRLAERLEAAFAEVPVLAEELGVDPDQAFEVEEIRRAMRVGPYGEYAHQAIVLLTQTVPIETERGTLPFDGGSTLVVDLRSGRVRYRVRKSVASERRRARTEEFKEWLEADPLRAAFLGAAHGEPFAVLHGLAGDGL